MASRGPGKVRERRGRPNKPYDRPKGIIRRVTDSVTGLFSTSWLSGWMAGEEEEEAGDQQQTTVAPPGESFIFAQPARRPYKAIYPEEGDTEGSSAEPLGVNEGASTSSGGRESATPVPDEVVPGAQRQQIQLGGDASGPSQTGRRLPLISSTPAPMFSQRNTKSQLEPRPLPLLSSSIPSGDDGSEVSESSVDTGVDASVIPRPDERDYQREILQLDEESLQTLRESLAKSAPAPPASQAAAVLPSLEETRKRPRETEQDRTSVHAEGSVSSRSLFSEMGESTLGQPQPSALASKRPRFNVSTFGSPLFSERSVLSNSSFKCSPFYPGKTMYGGASSYRRSRQPHSLNRPARTQVKPKLATESDDGGLSQAARRILESLEQMTTPLSDAKRIPTPSPSQRGSYLDSSSSYVTAFYKYRPNLRPSGPPTSRISTPTKVTIQENLSAPPLNSTSKNLTPAASTASSKSVPEKETSADSVQEDKGPADTTEKEETTSIPVSTVSDAIVTSSSIPPEPSVSSASKTDPSPPESASSVTFSFSPKTASFSSPFSSDTLQHSKKTGGKMKSKVVDSGRGSVKNIEETVETPTLPTVSLNMPSLPKINLPLTTPSTVSSPVLTGTEGFRFSTPEVVDSSATPEVLPSTPPMFTFRSPESIEQSKGNIESCSNTISASVPVMFNSSSSPKFEPKLKASIKKDAPAASNVLKEGSILDILKPKDNTEDKASSELTALPLVNNVDSKLITSSCSKSETETINSVTKQTLVSQGFQGFGPFKKSSDEWECSVCMIRNKKSVTKCAACENPNPEQKCTTSTTTTTSVKEDSFVCNVIGNSTFPSTGNSVGWGDAFKKSPNEWECGNCMIRNKESSGKCVACENPKPVNNSMPPVEVVTGVEGVGSKDEKNATIGFGTAFAKAEGEWECDTCLVRNKSDATKCMACETPKPGSASVSQAITGNFKFSANTRYYAAVSAIKSDVNTSDSTSTPAYKFGVSGSQPEVNSSAFIFGNSAKNAEDSSTTKVNSDFKFGVATEEKPKTLGFSVSSSFGGNSKPKEEAPAKDGFKFGLPSQGLKDKGSSITSPFSISSTKTRESCTESSSSTEVTGISFEKVENDSKTAADSTKEESNSKPASSSVPSDFKPSDALDTVPKAKESKPSEVFTFGMKPNSASIPTSKPTYGFNNVITSSNKDNESKSAASFVFGGAKSSDSEPVSSSTFLFGANAAEGDATTQSSSNAISFGNKISNPTPAQPFSFTNTGKEEEKETKVAPSLTTSSKRESSDGEPAKKMAFTGSAGLNSFNSPSSLFTFGNKENQISSGTGFGAVTSPNPTLEAPAAPTSSATPSFHFAPVLPAANATFGTPALPFGGSSAFSNNNNNNNNSTPSFAFGQPSEKKSSVGFNFGQAASNPTSQSLNFGQGTNSTVFQFGQNSSIASPSGVFQFGSQNTQAPAPAFGAPDNPFTATAPPSGRVVKRAVRRRKQ